MSDDQVICTCLDLTRGDIIAGIREHGCKTADDVADAIEAGAVCGSCVDDIQAILDELNEE
jgi:bacterioferritin-associated ferredoxin